MYPHYSKIFGCPAIFVKCWGVMGADELKWLYSSWKCILFSNGYSRYLLFMTRILSLDTSSQNETWWFVFSLSQISKNSHFCLVTLRCPPGSHGCPNPLEMYPTILKSSVARPFLWNVGRVVLGHDLKCLYSSWECILFSNSYSRYILFMTHIFVSWHMLSKWNLMVCVFAFQNSKNRHFSLMSLR